MEKRPDIKCMADLILNGCQSWSQEKEVKGFRLTLKDDSFSGVTEEQQGRSGTQHPDSRCLPR